MVADPGRTFLGRVVLLCGLALAEAAVAGYTLFALVLLPAGLGRLMLPSAASALRSLARRSRSRALRWHGVSIPDPYRSGPDGGTRRQRCAAVLGDAAFWRDLEWAVLDPLVGPWLAALPAVLVGYGTFGWAAHATVWWVLGQRAGANWYAFVPVSGTAGVLASAALGVVFVVVGMASGPAVLRLHARWSRLLLSPPRRARLEHRLKQLTDTRAEVLDGRADELRRIERDLHDGV